MVGEGQCRTPSTEADNMSNGSRPDAVGDASNRDGVAPPAEEAVIGSPDRVDLSAVERDGIEGPKVRATSLEHLDLVARDDSSGRVDVVAESPEEPYVDVVISIEPYVDAAYCAGHAEYRLLSAGLFDNALASLGEDGSAALSGDARLFSCV